MKQLFRGGLVVNGTSQKVQDILTENGKILAVGEHVDVSGAEVTDISGRIVFPGFIDSHTHMHLEVSDTVTADKFDSGSRAAIAGGTTCLIDFATQNRGETLAEALQNWHKKRRAELPATMPFIWPFPAGHRRSVKNWNRWWQREFILLSCI